MHKKIVSSYLHQKIVCENFLAELSQVDLYCPEYHFEKTSWLKICCFNLSGKLKKKHYAFCQKKLSEVVKKSFYVSCWCFFSLEKLKNAQMISFSVLTWKKNLRKFFGRLVEGALVLSTATFWKKNYFSDELFLFFLGYWV